MSLRRRVHRLEHRRSARPPMPPLPPDLRAAVTAPYSAEALSLIETLAERRGDDVGSERWMRALSMDELSSLATLTDPTGACAAMTDAQGAALIAWSNACFAAS